MEPPFEGQQCEYDGRSGTVMLDMYRHDGSWHGAYIAFGLGTGWPPMSYVFTKETMQEILVSTDPMSSSTAQENSDVPLEINIPEAHLESEDSKVLSTLDDLLSPLALEDPSTSVIDDGNGSFFVDPLVVSLPNDSKAPLTPEKMETDYSPVQNAIAQTARGIALPPYGDSDERYVCGPTGKWYSKAEAIKDGDEALSSWISKTYSDNANWRIESIIDAWTQRDGNTVYLVKFPGYELNPGVANDVSNPGDWYGEEEGIPKKLISAYYAKGKKTDPVRSKKRKL